MRFPDVKYGRHGQRVAGTIMQIMGSNPKIMTCSDGYLVGRLKNGKGRDGFKVRKAFTF